MGVLINTALLTATILTTTSALSLHYNNASTPEVKASDTKAGAGFLVIATFFLMGDYGLGYNEIENSRAAGPGAFEAEVATLRNRMSILEKVAYSHGSKHLKGVDEEITDQPGMCEGGNRNSSYRERVNGAVRRGLEFIGAHIDQLHTIEPAFALSALKVVDDKHGGELQKTYPITEWVNTICGAFTDGREAESCKALASLWKSRPGEWKPESIVHRLGTSFKTIGHDSEVIWGRLNGECQLALLTRCEVPYVCERTLFDPEPRSQYMLTHQLLQRIMAELGTCASAKDLLHDDVNHRLCAKIYKEAQLIHALDTPEQLKDLFAEQIGLCGYLGYPNFLRSDWLDLILSWQSKSEFGCFVREKGARGKFVSTDKEVKRVMDTRERENEMEAEDEYCLPHFTSVSLTALASYMDYIEEKCE